MNILDFLEKVDFYVFLFINGMHNRFFDTLMFYISLKYTWIPLYLFVLILIFKKYKFKYGLIIFLSFIFMIALSDQTSVKLFKDVFQRLRPCYDPELKGLVHYLGIPAGQYGFISSHAANSFAFAFLSSKLLNVKIYTWLIFFWAILVSYSRIYLGVHFPGDVIIGAFWGLFIGAIVYTVLKKMISAKLS